MLLLEEKTQNRLAAGSLALGLALSLNLVYRSFNPPKNVTPEMANAIAQAQINNERVRVNYASKPYLNSLLWKLFLTSGFFAGAIALADNSTRKTFQPDPAEPVDLIGLEEGSDKREGATKRLKKADSPIEASTEFQHDISREVAAWCKQYPWLMGMLKPPIVMVVGQPGAGKSSIMQTLALVRHLIFACGVDIADLDLDKNAKNRVWIHGQGYGSEKRGDYFEQLNELFAKLQPQMFPSSKGHTVIWDEISRMVRQDVCSEDELLSKFEAVHKEWRRQHIKCIMGLHGLGVDENMPSKSCGTFTSMRDAAAILYLEPKNNEFGEPVFSGLGYFKPAGIQCGPIGSIKKNWQRVAIPKTFQSSYLIETLGEAIDKSAIGLTNPDTVAHNKVYSWAASQVDKTLLEKGIGSGQTAEQLTEEFAHHARGRLVDWSQVEDLDELEDFWHNTLSDKATVSSTEGVYRVRELWRGWARYQDWAKVSDFKSYLQDLEELGLGACDDYTWAWHDGVEFPWL